MSDKKIADAKPELDEELSNLLDSALEDFGNVKKEDASDGPPKANEVLTTENTVDANPQQWSNDFIQEAASNFEANFANLLAGATGDEQISPEFVQQKLQQMADAAQQVLENPGAVPESSNDFSASISQAIQGLNAGAQGLNAPVNEEDLMRMFSAPGALGSTNDLLPFMQGMMQGLLSKEVLGPSLQDFVERLPEYIEKNKDTLSKEDTERYENQKKLMEEVLQELNKESESDSNDMKKERFSKVLALMQKLQDYGQPPAELVGDLDTPFNFDAQGNPMNMPNMGAPGECVLM